MTIPTRTSAPFGSAPPQPGVPAAIDGIQRIAKQAAQDKFTDGYGYRQADGSGTLLVLNDGSAQTTANPGAPAFIGRSDGRTFEIPKEMGTGGSGIGSSASAVLPGVFPALPVPPAPATPCTVQANFICGDASIGTADGTGTVARFGDFGITSIAQDAGGNTYVVDRSNYTIRKISPSGIVTTLAGGTQGMTDGVGAAAQFNSPWALAVDAKGNVWVLDQEDDTIETHAWWQGYPDGAGHLGYYTADGVDFFGNPLTLYPGTDSFASGNIRIRKITPLGIVTTVATPDLPTVPGGTFGACLPTNPTWALCTNGMIYFTVHAFEGPANSTVEPLQYYGYTTVIMLDTTTGLTADIGYGAIPYEFDDQRFCAGADGYLYVSGDFGIIHKMDANAWVWLYTISPTFVPAHDEYIPMVPAASHSLYYVTGITVAADGTIYARAAYEKVGFVGMGVYYAAWDTGII
jgi:hypothetical protein